MPVDNTKDSPRETGFVLCHGCGSPIHGDDQAAFLDSIRQFVRMRCGNPQCGRTEWYEESEFEQSTADAPSTSGPGGEVWIHDLLLGLSFRDPHGRV
jgi:hypothetical protein